MTKLSTKIIPVNVFKIIIYSIIYAIGIQVFMTPANLLTTGLAGVSQIIEKISGFNYGIIYILINIPGIIIGMKYLGRRFTIYSMFNIFTVSIITFLMSYIDLSFLPDFDIIIDVVFGGILIGFSVGKLLKMGASSGGTDFLAMYLLKYKNMDFSRVNWIINMIIIITGIFFFGLEAGLYTIISLYVRNTTLEQTFTNAQSVTLFIVGENLEKVSCFINNKLKRGTTIINKVEGGYTHDQKQIVMTTLNKYEYSVFINNIFDIDDNLFINIMDTNLVVGNFQKDKGVIKET